MKTLKLHNLYFKLPEMFSGGIPEALRELANYLESDTKTLPELKIGPEEPWLRFLEVVDNGGRVAGEMAVDFLKNQRWARQPHKIEGVQDDT